MWARIACTSRLAASRLVTNEAPIAGAVVSAASRSSVENGLQFRPWESASHACGRNNAWARVTGIPSQRAAPGSATLPSGTYATGYWVAASQTCTRTSTSFVPTNVNFSLSAPIDAVIATAEGLAVLTGGGIELLGRDLARSGTIAGDGRGRTLTELTDGRFVVYDRSDRSFSVTSIVVGRRGGGLRSALGDEHAHTVHATTAGFIAPASGKLWVDCGGDGRWVTSEHAGYGSCGLRDRIVTTSFESVAVFSERGDVLVTRPIDRARPIVVDDRVLLHDGGEIGVLALADLAALPALGHATCVIPFGSEILTLHEQADRIGCSGLEPGSSRWEAAIPDPMEPNIIGERIVVGSWAKPAAWILDRDGQVLIELSLAGLLGRAIGFGDGIALSVMCHRDVQWWRPNGA
jgi:hypothetical protein